MRIGDIDQQTRAKRAQARYRRYMVRIIIVVAFVGALLIGWTALYSSDMFTITNVKVTGVEHLTATEMTELASVPSNTTLLRVDTAAIENRLKKDAWVESVAIHRQFPDTLELVITEREIAAVVEIPIDNAQTTQDWAIASDGMWLMPIPELGSEASKTISDQVYEDAENVLDISDVPYGTQPEIGAYCTDANINNALAIVDGLTTDLADRVKTVLATGTETTTLILDDGVTIAFGTAEDIRDKERVVKQLLDENPGKITYINVRVVDRPTWRSL